MRRAVLRLLGLMAILSLSLYGCGGGGGGGELASTGGPSGEIPITVVGNVNDAGAPAGGAPDRLEAPLIGYVVKAVNAVTGETLQGAETTTNVNGTFVLSFRISVTNDLSVILMAQHPDDTTGATIIRTILPLVATDVQTLIASGKTTLTAAISPSSEELVQKVEQDLGLTMISLGKVMVAKSIAQINTEATKGSRFVLVGVTLTITGDVTGDTGGTGATGVSGRPPLQAGGTDVSLTLSAPANGTHFVAGEQIVVTATLKDQYDRTLTVADFSTLGLYMYGPQEPTLTKTAVKLLNATADRTKTPHHYINLLTNPSVVVMGNVLKYTLQPVTDELPGTYTVTLRTAAANSTIDNIDQDFLIADIQIGTASAETKVVDKSKCAACHLGADNGQFYFAHVDPRTVGQTGSPAIESWPVRTCKSCHNNDGYAAAIFGFNDTGVRQPDHIVNRVHGVHNGKNLKNPGNIDPTTGAFRDYVHVVFPADIKNCTYCHVDDRWKTKPSRLACGTCHDNVWFGDPAAAPATATLHLGGQQTSDAGCFACHAPDVSGFAPAVAVAHKVSPPAFQYTVELAMSAYPNGTHFVAGDTPTVTITLKNAATGAVIDAATIVEPAVSTNVQANEWRRANLFVSGPREQTGPALTTTAAGSTVYYYANNDFRVRIDPAKVDPKITRNPDGTITYQLGDVAGLEPGTYTTFVETLPATGLGGIAMINFQIGASTVEKKIATNCTTCHADTRMHASYFALPFDPDICKSCHDYERRGTGYGWAGAPPSGTNGTSTSGWSGFGAKPLSARVHGVHRGLYLNYPEDVKPFYSTSGVYQPAYDFGEVVFPQDIRNCGKCHSEKNASGQELLSDAWKTKPSRLACLACHDSDAAQAHGKLMTVDPTPDDPWSGDEVESCAACHGSGSAFSPDKVHNVANPYKPPYPREPVE